MDSTSYTENNMEIFTLLSTTIKVFSLPGSDIRVYSAAIQEGSMDDTGKIYNSRINALAGTLKSLKAYYEIDLLQSIDDMIHANVFSDFLEMAEYILEENYHVPAAILIGGVLEEHLVKLCIKNNISHIDSNNRRLKADTINNNIAAANVYNRNTQKQVTAWLGIKNSAAHPPFTGFSIDDVKHMHAGVKLFLQQNPL